MREKVTLGIMAMLLIGVLFAVIAITMAYLPEDLNEDGIVNIDDVAEAAKAFGSYLGHERWNEKADLNGDVNINILDLTAITKAFGKTE